MPEPLGQLAQFRDSQRVAAEVNGAGLPLQHVGDLGHAVLARGGGDGDVADLSVLPGFQHPDVGEAVVARLDGDRRWHHDRNAWFAVAGQRVQVAVIVVLVGNDHAVELRQLLHREGYRLAGVVGGGHGEPRVGEQPLAGDLYEVAAVPDPGHVKVGHHRFSCRRDVYAWPRSQMSPSSSSGASTCGR